MIHPTDNSVMQMEISQAQKEARERFRSFVQEHIRPYAAQWDREEGVSPKIVEQLRVRGYLGSPLRRFRDGDMDPIMYGLLTEEIGRGCSSVRSLLTVHDMVSLGMWRWGTAELKAEFADRIARGDLLCALALSEPETGSDAASVRTEARSENGEFILHGMKKWTTFGQIADLFLVLARCEDQLATFVVPANTPGFNRKAMKGISGTRASLLAEIEMRDCHIPSHYLVGKLGFGLSHVISTVLDHGRYSVAWGAVGIAQACLDACLDYTSKRRQFGCELREHQLVRRMLTDMIVHTRAARLLCYRAGYLRSYGDPGAYAETMIAKYYASRTAVRTANDAVQLHGANGVSGDYPVERYLRDAKVMEIIEGSTEIQQISIARFPLAEL